MSETGLAIGMTGTAAAVVDETNVAAAVGSGLLPVFGTPSLVALMEQAACNAVEGKLATGMTTVGAMLCVRHTAPTPLGETVTATAELTAVDGRKLTFVCRAADAVGAVGEGEQERYIVDGERFLDKMRQKRGRA